MGDDSFAGLSQSDKPRMLYDYFKQIVRPSDEPVRSTRSEKKSLCRLECYIGPEGNLLNTTPEQCHAFAHVPHRNPITDEECAGLKSLDGYRGTEDQG